MATNTASRGTYHLPMNNCDGPARAWDMTVDHDSDTGRYEIVTVGVGENDLDEKRTSLVVTAWLNADGTWTATEPRSTTAKRTFPFLPDSDEHLAGAAELASAYLLGRGWIPALG